VTHIEREHKWTVRPFFHFPVGSFDRKHDIWTPHGVLVGDGKYAPSTEKRIIQVYLDGTSLDLRNTERIRLIKEDGKCRFFHTHKTHRTAGEAYETEKEITNTEFSRLYRTFRSPLASDLVKTRRTFTWKDIVWEMDKFDQPTYSRYLLEAEVEDLSATLEPPPLWSVTKVTGDPKYSNAYLALTELGRLLWEDTRT